ncbi:MAG: AraC family transcriptional regulator [Candidatus Thiodiazotropha sp.]
MKKELSMATLYARYLPEVLQEFGYDPVPFLTRHQLTWDELNQPDARLYYDNYLGFLREILAKTDIPGLGLKTASHISLLKMGLYGYAMSSCKDLQQALNIHCNYSCLESDVIQDSLNIQGDSAIYSINPNLFRGQEAVIRFEVEQDFAMWFKAAEMWWEEPYNWFQKVEFSFDRPSYADLYEEFFKCRIRFKQPVDQFVFSTEHLHRPFMSFNAQMMQLTEEQCAKLLHEKTKDEGLAGKIRTLISCRGTPFPSAQEVSDKLNLSEITMRRRLKKEGTTYKTLLHEFRMELASRYLRETQIPVKEVAYITGYTDPANFTRAFTLFFSIPPNQYRDSAAGSL